MLYWILGLVTIAIVLYLFIPQKKTSTEKVVPEVPEAFRLYENLLDGFEADNYIAERIISSKHSNYAVLNYYNPADSSLIVLTNNYSGKMDASRPWMDTYLKLNNKGQIVDSLSRSYSIYREVLGHLITREHYCSWALDGDKTEKQYTNVSLDSSSTKEEMLINFTKHYHEAKIVRYRKDFDKPTKTWIHAAYFFMNDNWSVISQKNMLDFEEMFKEFLPKPHYEKIEYLQLPYDNAPWVNSTDQLKLEHFQQTKYHKKASSGTFNPNNYTRRAYWEGIAYLNLKIREDTIPFKLLMNQPEKKPEELSLSKGTKFTIFSHKTLDFIVLSNGDGLLNCIKPKN